MLFLAQYVTLTGLTHGKSGVVPTDAVLNGSYKASYLASSMKIVIENIQSYYN